MVCLPVLQHASHFLAGVVALDDVGHDVVCEDLLQLVANVHLVAGVCEMWWLGWSEH